MKARPILWALTLLILLSLLGAPGISSSTTALESPDSSAEDEPFP